MDDRAARLRQARLAAGFETAAAAAEAHGWNRWNVKSPPSASALRLILKTAPSACRSMAWWTAFSWTPANM